MADTPRRPRVAFTAGSIAGVVKARKRHRCESHLADERHFIEPGEQYVANALPPDHPEVGNDRWWHLRVCLDCCPAEYDARPGIAGHAPISATVQTYGHLLSDEEVSRD